MSYPIKDFGGTPWAAGSMYGIRRFGAHSAGHLLSAASKPDSAYVYRTGTNHARCLLMRARRILGPAAMAGSPDELVVPEQAPSRDHPVASATCSCGFWAYNDPEHLGRNDPGWAIGIIEGYGRVTYGPYGFRASQCRVVALIRPKMESAYQVIARRLRWETDSWDLYVVVFAATVLVFSALQLYDKVPTGFPFLVAVIAVILSAVLRRVMDRVRRAMVSHWLSRVERNYPDVRIFDTVEEALAAFPLTPQEGS